MEMISNLFSYRPVPLFLYRDGKNEKMEFHPLFLKRWETLKKAKFGHKKKEAKYGKSISTNIAFMKIHFAIRIQRTF